MINYQKFLPCINSDCHFSSLHRELHSAKLEMQTLSETKENDKKTEVRKNASGKTIYEVFPKTANSIQANRVT